MPKFMRLNKTSTFYAVYVKSADKYVVRMQGSKQIYRLSRNEATLYDSAKNAKRVATDASVHLHGDENNFVAVPITVRAESSICPEQKSNPYVLPPEEAKKVLRESGILKEVTFEIMVAHVVAEYSGVHASEIDLDKPYTDFGLDSLDVIEMVMELEDLLDISFSDDDVERVFVGKPLTDLVSFLKANSKMPANLDCWKLT